MPNTQGTMDNHARFLQLMAHIMTLCRAERAANTAAITLEMYQDSSAQPGRGGRQVMLLIEEAAALAESMPLAARFWAQSMRARFLVRHLADAFRAQAAVLEQDIQAARGICQAVSEMSVADNSILYACYSLYSCYSLTWAIADLPADVQIGFADLRPQLTFLAQAWPSADAMLQCLQADLILKDHVEQLDTIDLSVRNGSESSLENYTDEFSSGGASAEGGSASVQATPELRPTANETADWTNTTVSIGLGDDELREEEYGVPNFSPEETEAIADLILSGFTGKWQGNEAAAAEEDTRPMRIDEIDFDWISFVEDDNNDLSSGR